MSGSKTSLEQPRLLIAHIEGDFPEGATFEDWPLHLTFLPWFRADPRWTTELFRRALADFKACRVTLGCRTLGSVAMFGEDEDIPVRPILESTALGVVHGVLLGQLHPYITNKDWIGSNYNPHMTIRDNPDPGEGYVMSIDSLSMVQHMGDHKLVIARSELVAV